MFYASHDVLHFKYIDWLVVVFFVFPDSSWGTELGWQLCANWTLMGLKDIQTG